MTASRPQDATGPSPFVVANFNLHAGIDGWGRPFDVVAACAPIGADVLVLEECWTPDGDGPGHAQAIADELGYAAVNHPLASGRRALPHPEADGRWMRSFDWRGGSHAIYLDEHRPQSRTLAQSSRYREATPGTWGLAVLSRLPIAGHRVLDLGRLGRDRARRAALVLDVSVDGRTVPVIGTHMTHLSYGSPVHFSRLRHLVGEEVGPGPAVMCGDMNLWGPPVRALMPGWHRALRGKTWPAWNPHSQVDHILVRGPVRVLSGEVLATAGSDHRPIRATLAVG